MSFAPQRRALLNISTFVHFDFQMCYAPDHGVQFFISHLPRWLRTRRFSQPTVRPSGATNHLLPFRAPTSSFFWLFIFSELLSSLLFSSLLFSSLLFSSLLFSSLSLPTSAFPCVHIVGSLTSKLPSVRTAYLGYPCFWLFFNTIPFFNIVPSLCFGIRKFLSCPI